jgi:hypothetical protein
MLSRTRILPVGMWRTTRGSVRGSRGRRIGRHCFYLPLAWLPESPLQPAPIRIFSHP